MDRIMKAIVVFASGVLVAGAMTAGFAQPAGRRHENAVIDLWMQGKAAFGVFVPNESAAGGRAPQPGDVRPTPVYTRAGGEKLAGNPLYDFVFLNLEGRYDAGAVQAVARGLRSPTAPGRKTLIVRIPPFHDDPAAARTRVREVFASGGDGVTWPHVRSAAEARQILAVFREEGIDVWSPANPAGEKLVMMMIEDPGALAEAAAIADLPGYSILACGIGSLTQALKGDRAGAEVGTQRILAETKRVRLVNMLMATTADVEKRVGEGFLALLAQGQNADEAIRLGRAAAGR
jgi:hypothetical protein